MASLQLKDLIQSGMHFGHQASRWNPKMAPFIFQKRNTIHVIDVRWTVHNLIAAGKLVERVAQKGDYVLLVGTKRQAKQIVIEQAKRCGQPYVSERWPGGLLTNYSTVRLRLERLLELERMTETGEISLHSKKMISTFRREQRKITRNLGGVRVMDRMPGAVVVVDPGREYIAIREACKLGIPTIALTDTDCDPESLDIVVPGNDDSIGAIEIFFSYLADSALSGIAKRPMISVGFKEKEGAAQAPKSTGAREAKIAEPKQKEHAVSETESEAS